MTTPSGYPGSGQDPYGSAGQYSAPAGPGSYPPPGQVPYGNYPPQQFGGPAPFPGPSQYPSPNIARPGMVTAAAVLAFVVGGLTILGGLLTLLAGGIAASVYTGLGGIIIVLAILFLAVGALYIFAGLKALQGKNAKILVIVAGISVVLQLVSMLSDFTPTSLIGLAISAGIIALLLQEQSKAWFRAQGASTF